jgi:hypothetical protein
MILNHKCCAAQGERAITLVEVVMAMAVSAVLMGAVAAGFIQCMKEAEWSAYSLAANSLAMQRLEQTRAAKWDRLADPIVDEVKSTNFPVEIKELDIPMVTKTNAVMATNYTTILTISTNPPLKMVRVDCVWRFMDRGTFTNTIATYRAPDQ